jgi:hypothetical protein
MQTLDELMADFERERAEEIAKDEARRSTPKAIAAAQARRKEEFARGVRLGWWDSDGNPVEEDEDDEG